MKDRRSKSRRMKGSSAVEFALTLPIFIILVIGIIEFGWYYFVQHTLQYATREGMRLALVGDDYPGGTTLSPRGLHHYDDPEQRDACRQPRVGIGIDLQSRSSRRICRSHRLGNQTPNAGGSGEYMRVRSRYNQTFFTPLIGGFFTGGGIVIQAEGTYRNESGNEDRLGDAGDRKREGTKDHDNTKDCESAMCDATASAGHRFWSWPSCFRFSWFWHSVSSI